MADVMLIRWLMLGQRLVLPAAICALINLAFFVACYVEDGRWWPTLTDIELATLLCLPAAMIPALNCLARRLVGRPEALPHLLVGLPHLAILAAITLAIFAVDVLLALALGRNFVMTGSFLPKL